MLAHKTLNARVVRFELQTAEDAREYEAAFPGCRSGDTTVELTSEQFHSVKLYASNDAPFARDYMDKNWYAVDTSVRLRSTN